MKMCGNELNQPIMCDECFVRASYHHPRFITHELSKFEISDEATVNHEGINNRIP